MSLLAPSPPVPRKRTSLLPSCSRPSKSPRLSEMGSSLRRTESYISFTDIRLPSTPVPPPRKGSTDPSSLLPYNRTLQYYKDQRDRRKAQLNRTVEPITIRIATTPRRTQSQPPRAQPLPSPPRTPPGLPTVPIIYRPPRQSSPLSPTRASRPSRPVFPRSKPEPDLYRKAIKTCMQASPEGQKILRMGPRLALSIMTATKDLERIVAAQNEADDLQDVVMLDTNVVSPVNSGLTKSWVFVPGEDWEMVDCTA